MTSTFARFPPRLQQAIATRLGWTALRPVQELAGQAILDGQNCLILAPTHIPYANGGQLIIQEMKSEINLLRSIIL